MAATGSNKPFSWGGITGAPLSTTLPTDHDLKLQEALIAELREQNNFASPDDIEIRKHALTRLQKIVTEFVRLVGKKKGLSQSAIDNAGGKIFTFGSYKLGVFGPGSDIDTLLVAPKHVTRDDFFELFPDLLRRKSSDVPKELTPVPDAHTPIIKLKWANVDIDLIFVSLKTSSIPENIDLKEESHLRGLDETDLRSINGTRVSDEILSLLPEAKAFRHTLRAVKLWAQRRGIYGNVFGFPGGVAWAILVGRICQLYPCATGATIVTKFFNLMAQWPWPKPVMLKHHQEQGPLQVRVWNPAIYPSDAGHLMPILTPAYPGMCCTHNVTQSTKAIILRELARANQIASDILNGKKPWNALFEKQTFFTQDYKHYLSIHCASRTKDDQHIWCGYVQSRVRRLVTGIELSAAGVKLAHPYVKGFDRIHVCKIENIDAVLMGDLQYEVKEAPQVVRDGYTVLYSTTYYLGLEMKEVSGGQLDISHAVSDFTHQSTQWQSYMPDENFLRVVHTRNYDLPLDVFEHGEKRPVKKKKKATAGKPTNVNGATDAASQPNSLKRKSTDGVESPNAKRQRPHDTPAPAVRQVNDVPRNTNGVVTPTPAG